MLRRIPIYIAMLPLDLFAWSLILLIHVLWGEDLRWRDGVLSTSMRPGSFPVRKGKWPVGWYLYNRETGAPWGGTSIGHAQFHGGPFRAPLNEPLTPHEAHEYHHVRQAEASQIAAFLCAIMVLITLLALEAWVAAAIVPLVIWSFGSVSVSFGGWAAAWIRGDSRGFYRGSAHEIGAYAVEEVYAKNPFNPHNQP